MHRLNCLSNTVLNKSNEAQMVSGQRTLPQLEDGLANAAQLGGFSALAAQLEDNSLPYAQAVLVNVARLGEFSALCADGFSPTP